MIRPDTFLFEVSTQPDSQLPWQEQCPLKHNLKYCKNSFALRRLKPDVLNKAPLAQPKQNRVHTASLASVGAQNSVNWQNHLNG